MTRVAVQTGAAWLRVAAEGRVVAELPAGRAGLPAVLAELFDGPPDEVVVVEPVAPETSGPIAAGAVVTVPAAVAALAATGHPAGVVVDVGLRRTEITHVDAGRIVRTRSVRVGGADLDATTAEVLAGLGVTAAPPEARRVRETLSLLPEVRAGTPPALVTGDDLHPALSAALGDVVEGVRAVVAATGAASPPPVLLVGGVARAPLLAELLDDAGVADVRVPERPDCAAVLGALRLPGRAAAPQPDPPASPAPSWLPPVRPPRHRAVRAVAGAAVAAVAAIGLLATGTALPQPRYPGDELVQYGYAVRLPAGWAHTGGEPEERRSLLTPAATPEGSDLIAVERRSLGYDADAEPQRARAELRALFDGHVADGAPLSGFDDDARYAGRRVVTYRETRAAGEVDWYLVLDGDAQFSVGCAHTPTRAALVDVACATVVGSVRSTG